MELFLKETSEELSDEFVHFAGEFVQPLLNYVQSIDRYVVWFRTLHETLSFKMQSQGYRFSLTYVPANMTEHFQPSGDNSALDTK